MAESDWVSILNKIGFRHPILHRLWSPSLPPQFARSEQHLRDAWDYQRNGDPDACLASCYKAFECIGFSLTGKEMLSRM
jgi:hypothetical protein